MALAINIIRQNGNIPTALPGEDHISGLMFYIADADLPIAADGVTDGFSTTNRIISISTPERAVALGLSRDAEKWIHRVIYYHISECLRMGNGVSLYVGLFAEQQIYDFTEVKTMQNFTDGRLRQIGVWCGDRELAQADLTALQAAATVLEAQMHPLSIIYQPKIVSLSALSNLRGNNQKNVSITIGQDGGGTGADLYANDNSGSASVGVIGCIIGAIAKAKVNECIAWGEKFPTGLSLAAFGNGQLLRNTDKATTEQFDTYGYIYLNNRDGQTGVYFSDSQTMDTATSDYNAIERERTMDKAVRGVIANLSLKTGMPLKLDAETGKLASNVVASLKNAAGQAIEQMERDGELSGFAVEIDPEQNVLATGKVEFLVKNVPMGVMRLAEVKIGYYETV
ncbi:MAG: DUF2586 domain-containing protein [Bacteroidales bacterium]|jgi:hypothetical protein|nr:DUF2586 domain-containing protein [Bacteroidales bacterium]